MNVKEYVNQLFAPYPDGGDMQDFKEEIGVNLEERIRDLCKKGASEAEAFARATAELGDITAVAEDLSRQKRKEVIGDMYMKTRNYMTKGHIAGYIILGSIVAFGLLAALLSYGASGEAGVFFAVLIVFVPLPVAGFVYLGLTQETASNMPMKRRRALGYAAGAFLVAFGLVVFGMLLLMQSTTYIHSADGPTYRFNSGDMTPIAAIAVLIPFVLPGGIILAALGLTQKSRAKPWLVELQAKHNSQYTMDSSVAARFGIYSAALWMVTFGLFVLLGYLVGFGISWVVFLFAAAGEMVLLAKMLGKPKQG